MLSSCGVWGHAPTGKFSKNDVPELDSSGIFEYKFVYIPGW